MSRRGDGSLFIGRLSKNTQPRHLEDVFEPYGRLIRCDVKYGAEMAYGFVDYEDRRDAEDALKYENGREICGSSIRVEWAKGNPRRPYAASSNRGGGMYDECYRCHRTGHFARDCPNDSSYGFRRSRGGGGRYGSRRRSRSRSRSPYKRRRSYSRSRSRSRDRRRSRSASGDRRRSRSRSASKSRSRSRSISRSKSRSPINEGGDAKAGWHFIYTPPNKRGSFQVKSLSSEQLVKNGTLDSKAIGLEEDRALFCADESGRILHIDSTSVSMYQLDKADSSHSELKKCFTINLGQEGQEPPPGTITTTTSGRHVRRISLGSMLQMDAELPNLYIHNVDYENELNLLWTSVDYSVSEDKVQSYLRFHDIISGKTLKKIELKQPFEESMHEENNLYVDLDTVVQTVRSFNSEFACVVYRLQSTEGEQSQEADSVAHTKSPVERPSTQRSRRSRRSRQNLDGEIDDERTLSNTQNINERTSGNRRRSSRQDSDEEWSVESSSSETTRPRRQARRGVSERSLSNRRQRGRRRTRER